MSQVKKDWAITVVLMAICLIGLCLIVANNPTVKQYLELWNEIGGQLP